MFSKDIGSISPNFNFMLLEDIDRISNIFEILLDEPSCFSGLVSSEVFKLLNFQHFEIDKNNDLKYESGFLLELFEVCWGLKR